MCHTFLVPVKVNYTMFGKYNETIPPRMEISCEPILNSTAIVVTWKQTTTSHVSEFEVNYNVYGGQASQVKTIRTKYHNVTIYGVLPGTRYDVKIRTRFPQRPLRSHFTKARVHESKICTVPNKGKYRVYVYLPCIFECLPLRSAPSCRSENKRRF